jgi:alanine racemase
MNTLVIETDKLIQNINIIKKTVKSKIIGVIKGDGYGLSLLDFANILRENGIDMFAVCELWEARALRENGFTEEILLMRSTSNESEARQIIELSLTATIGSYDSAVVLNGIAIKFEKDVKAHIEVDTGFGRSGFMTDETDKVSQIAKFLNNIEITGIYTHFSNSFGKLKDTEVQYSKFNKFVEQLQEQGISVGLKHAANSCAALLYPNMSLDAVRIGSAFLGRLPVKNIWDLKNIGYLTSEIIEIKWLPKGHNVGYANVYKTKKAVKTAVVPLGYTSGYCVEKSRDTHRFIDVLRYMYNDFKKLFINKHLFVTINNKHSRVLGRVCMCNVVVDISSIDCNVGDQVIFEANPLFVDKSVRRIYI